MDDELFDWDDANILHVAEHDVTPEEAEEVILGEPMELGFEVVGGEDRWPYIGETSQGRILRVVITLRGERIRVVTAFEPPKASKAIYQRRKAGEI
ncbi:MAG: BrnT family toxin [Terracidiphilus sp.]